MSSACASLPINNGSSILSLNQCRHILGPGRVIGHAQLNAHFQLQPTLEPPGVKVSEFFLRHCRRENENSVALWMIIPYRPNLVELAVKRYLSPPDLNLANFGPVNPILIPNQQAQYLFINFRPRLIQWDSSDSPWLPTYINRYVCLPTSIEQILPVMCLLEDEITQLMRRSNLSIFLNRRQKFNNDKYLVAYPNDKPVLMSLASSTNKIGICYRLAS